MAPNLSVTLKKSDSTKNCFDSSGKINSTQKNEMQRKPEIIFRRLDKKFEKKLFFNIFHFFLFGSKITNQRRGWLFFDCVTTFSVWGHGRRLFMSSRIDRRLMIEKRRRSGSVDVVIIVVVVVALPRDHYENKSTLLKTKALVVSILTWNIGSVGVCRHQLKLNWTKLTRSLSNVPECNFNHLCCDRFLQAANQNAVGSNPGGRGIIFRTLQSHQTSSENLHDALFATDQVQLS